MCLIIYFEKDKKEEMEHKLNHFWDANDDGVGIIWIKNNNVFWKKGFMKFNEFKNFYNNLDFDKCIIHFRFSTSGLKDEFNTHPFLISPFRENELNGEKYFYTIKCF